MDKTLLKAAEFNESRIPENERVISILYPLGEMEGFCFAVIDVRGVDGNVSSLLNLLREQLERCNKTISKESNLQHRFEQVVQTINERIATLSQEENWTFKAKEVNALLGLAGGDALYLSGIGDLTAIFLHQTDQGRYKVFNLFRSLQTENHIPDWSKLFSIVLDGDLNPGDALLIGNKELPQHVDADDLNSLLTTLPPKSSVEKIRQYFPYPADIGLLVFRADAAHGDQAMPNPSDAEGSLDHLTMTQDTTSRMIEHQRPRKQDWPVIARSTIKVLIAILISSFSVALAILMSLVKSVITGGKAFLRSDKKVAWGSIRSKVKGGASTATTQLHRMRSNTQNLSKKRKIILIVIAVIITIFIVGLVIRSGAKSKTQEQATYQALVEDIQDKLDVASASIIYKDEDQAQRLLSEGVGLIDSLPTSNKTEREDEQRILLEQFETELNKLRRISPVGEMKLLASLPDGSQAAMIGFDNDTAYAFTTDKKVYKYNSDTSGLEALEVTAPENFDAPIRSRYDDLNNVIYTFDGRQIAKFDPDQITYEIVSITDLNRETNDVEIYARRVYALSSTDEQIYRHNRAGSDFGAPSRWLEARTVSLKDATSISVDGSVWVLKQSGQIVKYQSGLEENWKNATVDPAFSGTPILWTTDQVDDIYIIDTDASRIVVVDKSSGNVKKQLTHDSFNDLHGMWEKDGKIWILTGSGLYQFDK